MTRICWSRFFIKSALSLCFVLLALVAPASGQDNGPIDYLRMAHPEVAERIGLTDAQRAEVQRLLTARAMSLAMAKAEQRDEIHANTVRELKKLLTKEQSKKFADFVAVQKIKFRFDNQPWLQVLQWLAEQSDMTLVYDELPKQPFNFRDEKEYTVPEAMDLVNGILLSKGYTLVRRDKLLMVANLNGGLPSELIPEITPQQLGKYGQFEIVRMKVPLGKRPLETVAKEIKPLIGPRGKLDALPMTNQLVVTETSGKIRAIQALIQSIPEPKPPKPKAKPKAAPPKDKPKPKPKPEFVVHQVERLDIPNTVETLQKLVPGAKLTFDVTASEIQAVAVPNEQSLIKATLSKMMENSSPEKAPKVRVFTVKDVPNESLAKQLQLLAPNGQFSVDPETRKVVAFARPDQLEVIASYMAQLGAEGGAASEQVAVYQLKNADAESTLTMLQTMFAEASVAAEPSSNTIVLRGFRGDKSQVDAVIESIDVAPDNRQQLKTYVLRDSAAHSTIQEVVSQLLPEVSVHWNARSSQLFVVASSQDHLLAAEAISGVIERTGERQSATIKAHRVTQEQQGLLQEWAASSIPSATLKWDAGQRRLMVVATPGEHAQMAEFLTSLKGLGAQDVRTVKFYQLNGSQHGLMNEWLVKNLPSATLKWDNGRQQLTVMASEEDHTKIGGFIANLKQINFGAPDRFQVHALPKRRYDLISDMLKKSAPAATFKWNDREERLVVFATDEDHKKITKVLTDAERLTPGEAATTVRKHLLENQQSYDAIATVLKTLTPRATLHWSELDQQLLVIASEKDHALIEKTIGDVAEPQPRRGAATLKTHAIAKEQYDLLEGVIGQVATTANVRWDENLRQMVVVASANDQARIASLLEDVKSIDFATTERSLQSYRFAPKLATSVDALVENLQAKSPEMAIVNNDATSGDLTVLANKRSHDLLSKHLTELMRGLQDQPAQSVKVFPLQNSDAEALGELIGELFPNTRIRSDVEGQRLIAWGTAETLKDIERVINQTDVRGAGQRQQLIGYRVGTVRITTLIKTLAGEFPDMVFNADLVGNRLLAWGSERDHERLAELVAQYRDATANSGEFRVFKIRDLPAREMEAMLSKAMPNATFVADRSSATLSVWASPEELEKIDKVLTNARTGGFARSIKTYDVPPGTARAAEDLIQSFVFDAGVERHPDDNKLLILSDEEGHRSIAKLLDSLNSTATKTPLDEKFIGYKVRYANLKTLVSSLNSKFPKMTLLADTINDQILAWGSGQDHERFQKLIEGMQTSADRTELRMIPAGSMVMSELITTLNAAAPAARFTPVESNNTVMAWATPLDYKKIDEVLAHLESTNITPRSVTVYNTPPGFSATIVGLLSESLPQASVSPKAGVDQIIVTATEKEHREVARLIESVKDTPAEERTVSVYQTPNGFSTVITNLLASSVPQASVVPQIGTNRLIVTATPRDHKEVERIIGSIEKDKVARPTTKVYALDHAPPSGTIAAIQATLPNAQLTPDVAGRRIVVVADAADHERVAEMFKALDVDSDSINVTLKSYALTQPLKTELLTSLQTAMPEANISYSAANRQLVAIADARTHTRLAEMVGQLQAAKPGRRYAKSYQSPEVSTATAFTVLSAMFEDVDDLQMTVNSQSDSVVLFGDDQMHQRAANVVAEISGSANRLGKRRQVRVYPLKHVTPETAAAALTRYNADIPVVADDSSRSVIVTASEADHTSYAEIIGSMDRAQTSDLITKTYVVDGESAESVFDSLTSVMESEPDTKLALDPTNRKILAVAPEPQQTRIAEIITSLGAGEDGESRTMKSFDVGASDGYSLSLVLDNLYKKQSRPPELQFNEDSNQMIAVGTQQQLVSVGEAIEKLKSPEREIEVFSLRNNDAFEIESAIDALFANVSDRSAPAVDSNFELQQLIVRATPVQMKRVRGLLEKLGEKMDSEPNAASGNVRVVPFYGDADSVLENVQRLWEQVHTNELKVVYPSDRTEVKMVTPPEESQTRPVPDSSLPKSKSAVPEVNANSVWQRPAREKLSMRFGESSSPLRRLGFDSSQGEWLRTLVGCWVQPTAWLASVVQVDIGDQEADTTGSSSGQPESTGVPARQADRPNAKVTEVQADTRKIADLVVQPAASKPPVTIIPGENQLTLVSDDPKALDALEAMLLDIELNGRRGPGSRIGVYGLRNADAQRVTELLTKLFKEIPFPGRTSDIVLTADSRLNLVIVHGAPTGQKTVEELLRVLDMRENIDRLRLAAPRSVRIENTNTKRVMGILESVYKTQLSTGGAQQKVSIPKGVSPEVAKALEQVNASRAAPLLTLTEDQTTNSIYVSGPDTLVNEVAEFIRQLDQESLAYQSRGIRVISLKSLRSETVQELLSDLLQD